ncbi:hypothetical protein ACFL51_00125 [Myxococcota bacterium]
MSVHGTDPVKLKKVTKPTFDEGCPVPRIVKKIHENFYFSAEGRKAFAADVRAAAPVSGGGKAVDYHGFERTLGAAAAKLECAVHRDVLRCLDVDDNHVVISGKRHTRVGRYPATYYMTGPVTIERSLYRPDVERNAKTVDPISMRAGVIGAGWLPRTAQAMAHALQKGTSREA